MPVDTLPDTQPIDTIVEEEEKAEASPLAERPRVRPNQMLWYLLDQTTALFDALQRCEVQIATLENGQRERHFMQSTVTWAILLGVALVLLLVGILVGAMLFRGPVLML